MSMASRTAYSTWTPQKPTLFDGHYLRNRSTLDIGVLGYIVIVQHKEHSPEFLSIPAGTPCMSESSRYVGDPKRGIGGVRRNAQRRLILLRNMTCTLLHTSGPVSQCLQIAKCIHRVPRNVVCKSLIQRT